FPRPMPALFNILVCAAALACAPHAALAQPLLLAQAPAPVQPPVPTPAQPPAPAPGQPPAPPAPAGERLTLEHAHMLALQNHPGIAASGYRAQAATEVFKEARSGLLPQVNLYGDDVEAHSDNTRIMAGGLNNPSVFDRRALGASLSQLITDFGRTSNLSASARLQASAAGQDLEATREQVLLDVDRAYFGALQALAVQRVAQQTLDTRQLL